jgi:threonine/homoserine/homoserine lactone efflux protein
MSDLPAVIAWLLLVLSMPGPTNTLLATAGATTEYRRCLILVPAALSGYLVSVGLLLLLVRPITESFEGGLLTLRVASAAYLVYLAWTLWGASARRAGGAVQFRHVFVTTLLNPKAVVIAFVIFPAWRLSDWSLLPDLGMFAVTIAVCSVAWLTLGATLGLRGGAFITPRFIQRGAALVMGCFAATLFVSVLL